MLKGLMVLFGLTFVEFNVEKSSIFRITQGGRFSA
jgi:hypothetical protein